MKLIHYHFVAAAQLSSAPASRLLWRIFQFSCVRTCVGSLAAYLGGMLDVQKAPLYSRPVPQSTGQLERGAYLLIGARPGPAVVHPGNPSFFLERKAYLPACCFTITKLDHAAATINPPALLDNGSQPFRHENDSPIHQRDGRDRLQIAPALTRQQHRQAIDFHQRDKIGQ
jgi:hypothetical protein